MTETILVTGGAGCVALACRRRSSRRPGYAPVVLDNFATSTRAVLPRLATVTGAEVPCIEADVRDVEALRRGVPRPPDHGRGPLRRVEVDRRGRDAPANVLRRQCRRRLRADRGHGEAGVASLVYSSSATVYGQPEQLPVTEDAPLAPQSVYGPHQAHRRGIPARPRPREPQLADRNPALFQSGGRASVPG